jgi:dihydrofolate reductase
MSVIHIGFITMDGVVTDPSGISGTARGGWLLRYGREAFSGDRFQVGQILEEGVMLLGRTTWEQFSRLWPGRDDPFSVRMNAAAKLVASHTLTDVSAWNNSSVLVGDLIDAVKTEQRDVVTTGSQSILRQLAAADLVDEYRLITVPTVLGEGERLFPAGGPLAEFDCTGVEESGPFALVRYRRIGR